MPNKHGPATTTTKKKTRMHAEEKVEQTQRRKKNKSKIDRDDVCVMIKGIWFIAEQIILLKLKSHTDIRVPTFD